VKKLFGIVFVVYVIFLMREAFTGFTGIFSPFSLLMLVLFCLTYWLAGKSWKKTTLTTIIKPTDVGILTKQLPYRLRKKASSC
jgi:hypothetical protein